MNFPEIANLPANFLLFDTRQTENLASDSW